MAINGYQVFRKRDFFQDRSLASPVLFRFQRRFMILKKFLDKRRVQVRPDFHDPPVVEPADPAIPVAEGNTVECGGQGFEFNCCGIFRDKDMGHPQQDTFPEHPVEPPERVGNKILLVMVGSGQRMSSHDRPVNIVGYVLEECIRIAGFQMGEKCPDLFVCYGFHM